LPPLLAIVGCFFWLLPQFGGRRDLVVLSTDPPSSAGMRGICIIPSHWFTCRRACRMCVPALVFSYHSVLRLCRACAFVCRKQRRLYIGITCSVSPSAIHCLITYGRGWTRVGCPTLQAAFGCWTNARVVAFIADSYMRLLWFCLLPVPSQRRCCWFTTCSTAVVCARLRDLGSPFVAWLSRVVYRKTLYILRSLPRMRRGTVPSAAVCCCVSDAARATTLPYRWTTLPYHYHTAWTSAAIVLCF